MQEAVEMRPKENSREELKLGNEEEEKEGRERETRST